MEQKREKIRYYLVDALRGFTLLVMIGYHLSYDVFILYDRYPGWLSNPLGFLWQQYICITFILICGLSASFSRSNLKRGILLNGCGLLVTVVTKIFSPEAVVYFGVLNLLGCSLLLLIPIKKWIHQDNWKIWGGLFFLFFLLTRNINEGFLGLEAVPMLFLPEGMYQHGWMIPLGFPTAGFYSSDYFSIFPWFFLFMVGYCSSYWLKESETLQRLLAKRVPLLTWLGQHSLLIYLLHQPILMGYCMLLFQ